jgi:hypothetical protein
MTLHTEASRPMRSLPTLLIALLLLAACAADPPAATPTDDTWTLVITDGDPGDAPGISVADALTHGPTDDIVTVSGALFVDADGTVLLCDAIAESFPPQCGGERIEVDGLDLATVELEEANGVRWAEGVTLLGSVE